MPRKVTIAFCLCFILVFAALWHYQPSHKLMSVLLLRKGNAVQAKIELPERARDVSDALSVSVMDRHNPPVPGLNTTRKQNANHSFLSRKRTTTQSPFFPESPTGSSPSVFETLSKNTASSFPPKLKSRNQGGPVLLLFWSTWFGKRLDLNESWKPRDCPVECHVTSDVTRYKTATAFIVHARDPFPLPPRDDVPWILYTQENPVNAPILQDETYMSQFKLLKSYRLDADFPDPTFTAPDFSPAVPFRNKTGNIMAVFSNCERVRMEYMRQLMEFVDVDSYGRCHPTKSGLVPRGGAVDFREQKTKLARKYKFLLVFFNEDCDYFVDDQLLHALNAGTIPVVMGTDKIDEFMPGNLRHAYINVRNFTSARQLADHLTFLGNNETEYMKYLEWKSKGFGDINNTVIGRHFFPKYPPYCQVCVAVAEGRVHEEGLKADYCRKRRFSDWGLKIGAVAEEITK